MKEFAIGSSRIFAAITLTLGVAQSIGGAATSQVHDFPSSPAMLSQFHAFGVSRKHVQYDLVILGTFGGPTSIVVTDTGGTISEDGTVTGCADTSIPDPNYPNFNPSVGQDRYIQHEFRYRDGIMTDLGALPGANSSCAEGSANVAISGDGLVIAPSGDGAIDPLTGWPEARAVLWKGHEMIDLRTLGGHETIPIAVNDRGEVTGAAANTTSDPLSFFGFGTQTRAFLWRHERMQDLGTLGGPDAFGIFVNDRGQVLGFSYVNSVPNATTGIPTGDGFLWDHGVMMDIKDPLGGTIVSPFVLNNHGEVVGRADILGDVGEEGHPFLWDRGVFTDLGTFGGRSGSANWINDAGQIAGGANLCDSCFHGLPVFHAFLWEDGFKSDLGAVGGDGCSIALHINLRGEIVGFSLPCDGSTVRASLWRKHEPAIDLNSAIPPNSGFRLFDASSINDRGDIVGFGALPNGDGRDFLLIPTEDGNPGRVIATASDLAALHAPMRSLTRLEIGRILARLNHRRFNLRRQPQTENIMRLRTLHSLRSPFGQILTESGSASEGSAAPGAQMPLHTFNAERAHHHYALIDMGTFGGPASWVAPQWFASPTLNMHGVTIGGSSTRIRTSPTSNFLVCGGLDGTIPFVNHAFRFADGSITDLGALSGSRNCSGAASVNAAGVTVGGSENGLIDPVTGVNATRAILWDRDGMHDLGSFGGNQNGALGISDRGDVVGFSLNEISDPFSLLDFLLGSSTGTQTRAFLWRHGRMVDLGTLGGPDATALFINERGQIAGYSYTSSIPNSVTGLPPADPYLWENGVEHDLGTLGGAFGLPDALNNRGEVVGKSAIASDPGACIIDGDPHCHAFLWRNGKMIDLFPNTGENDSFAAAINDAGEIVGETVFPHKRFHAYIWRNGVTTDLGALDGDCFSTAQAVNSHSQVVGNTLTCSGKFHHPFLWENNSMVDLNGLIPTGSSLQLRNAEAINDRGEIAGIGTPRGCSDQNLCGHAFLLVPCDGGHPFVRGCDYSLVDAGGHYQPSAANQRFRTIRPAR
jgi:probable HAF family extracellular repeat protein